MNILNEHIAKGIMYVLVFLFFVIFAIFIFIINIGFSGEIFRGNSLFIIFINFSIKTLFYHALIIVLTTIHYYYTQHNGVLFLGTIGVIFAIMVSLYSYGLSFYIA